MKKFILFLVLVYSGYIGAWNKRDAEKFGLLDLSLKMMLKCEHNRTLDLNVNNIKVYFYDFQKNVSEYFLINEAAKGILSTKNLDHRKRFFIFVNGFRTKINGTEATYVRDGFRNFPDSYLIIIDHSAYTNASEGMVKSYERSVKYVYYIGKRLAQMLAVLYNGGISTKNFHCIGHSLGSQILGHVGDFFTKETGKKISRITALDPAGPCFSNSLIQEQIRSGVAEYVEVYHCNAGALGTSSLLGDVDFFVNKGKSQTNCSSSLLPEIIDTSLSAKCHHETCVKMWMASVARKDWYKAYKCEKYKNFIDGNCFEHETTTAGFWNPGKTKGVYYFSTVEVESSIRVTIGPIGALWKSGAVPLYSRPHFFVYILILFTTQLRSDVTSSLY